MSKSLNPKSSSASATIDGAKVLSKKAQENLDYLQDMYGDQFDHEFIALLFEDYNYDVDKCAKALDKLSSEAEAKKKVEQRTDALFNRLRANYDEKLVDDELLRLLIEENQSDEVAVCRQVEEMTKEVKKSSDSLVARMQHKFKHVIDAPIIALVAAEVNYNEDACITQLTALSASAPVTRAETSEQFLQSIFPQYDNHVLISCFTEQGKDLSKTIDHFLAMESTESSTSDEISDESSSDWSVMQELFPALDSTALQHALDQHSGDVPAAVETLLRNNPKNSNKRKPKTVYSNNNTNLGNRQVARINQWDNGEELSAKLKLEQLQRQFPKIERDILASVFTENNYHVAKTVQCLNTIYGLDDKSINNTNLPNLDKPVPVSAPITESKSDTRQKATSARKEAPFKTVTYKKGNSAVVPGPKSSAANQSCTELRTKIREQMHVIQQSIWARNQYFQSACSAYCHGDGAAANALRNKGRDYEVKMSSAVKLLANYIFLLHRAEGQTISSVDLHGLQVKEARQVLNYLLDFYAETQTKFLRVITGAGKHSMGGKAKLRPEVEDLLHNRQLEYQLVGDGAFLVYLR